MLLENINRKQKQKLLAINGLKKVLILPMKILIYINQPAGYSYGGKATNKVFESKNRYCEYEQTTNQYLGYELTGVKKGQNYKEYVFENMEIGNKIKKYFKF